MYSPESVSRFYNDVVPEPAAPESLMNPTIFMMEFGRNKPGEEGRTIFTRNDFFIVNWTNQQELIDTYIQQNPGWGLYTAAFEYYFEDPQNMNRILHMAQNLKGNRNKNDRKIIKREMARVISLAYLRGDFFLDFDDEEDISKAQEDAYRVIRYLNISPKYKIPLNMMRVYFSGKKGIHVIVPRECFGVNWHYQLDRVYRVMAKDLLEHHMPNKTLDMSVYERRRLFRLAGSQHPSTGCYKVPMELNSLLGKSMDDIQLLSKDARYGSWIQYEDPRTIPEAQKYFRECEQSLFHNPSSSTARGPYKTSYSKQGTQATLDFVPPCFQLMLEKGPVEKRNNIGSMLTAFWRQRGLSEQEAWDNLVDWNKGSLEDWELQTLFDSNFHGPYIYTCEKIVQNGAECPVTCKQACRFYKER